MPGTDPPAPPRPAAEVAEAAARDSYGRLVAYLSCRHRDIAGVEDALGDAFIEALTAWPVSGVPASPEGWLLTVARRRLIDGVRRASRVSGLEDELLAMIPARHDGHDGALISDDRLRLMFVCAHPSIDESARAPLMLQTILGFTAETIASAFITSPASMSQRLVRAKLRIRDLAVPFDVPHDVGELTERLSRVLDAIYICFNAGWSAWSPLADAPRGLEQEAIRLAGLIIDLMPNEPEPRGLCSLMMHCRARQAARLDEDGNYVPLLSQNVRRWDASMIEAAEQCLLIAASAGRVGPYQLEAAIQSAHAQRAANRSTPWADVLLLYDELIRHRPSMGSLVARAAALMHAGSLDAALVALDALPATRTAAYQPYHAVRASVLAALGRSAEARDAFGRAIGFCEDPAIRAYLLREQGRLPM